MDFPMAKCAIFSLLGQVSPRELPKLIEWLKTTNDFDEYLWENNDVILQNIAEDLRSCMPMDAVLESEHRAIEKMKQKPEPTVHVDAFLYSDDLVDALCEEGKMSRHYCVSCGSHQIAPLAFLSHSFSRVELKFLYQHVLPDLTGKILIDTGSRLGAILFGGYLYSSAARLQGVEINADFCRLQEMILRKYNFADRIQVVHADVCTQASLLQAADVIVLNNVFEYFLEEAEQCRAWIYISSNVRKKGTFLVTVPSLEESLHSLETGIDLSQWVKEVQLDYNVYLGKETDEDALSHIHLYQVL
ncbi:uncharacterized protein LOC115478094 [Microcaecilia unicolor]|uniref:Uncharacterized protein LOC115478094 n=1 Tax=Microcaecilia unicolor TaxID=1415580 RepID=A0A6P7Z1Q4_9AMPH|nr:uncharacterized protein LOC115478094 [Microcaecilia unicolor]